MKWPLLISNIWLINMKASLCVYHNKGKEEKKKHFKVDFNVYSKDGKDVDYDTITEDDLYALIDELISTVGNANVDFY